MNTITNVVDQGICVGCGACATSSSNITMTRNRLGYMVADLSRATQEALNTATKICPFSNESRNEDELSDLFLPAVKNHDPRVGKFITIFAGRVIQGEDLTLSSSGGMTSWLTLKLLELGHIDGVIHVGKSPPNEHGLFNYCISRSSDELRSRRKSIYYSTSISDAIKSIAGDGKKYAFVGVPCFVKAIRLLASQDQRLRAQIPFTVGIICGHLKSSGFAELLAWQLGIRPENLHSVDFREKVKGRSANDYNFAATGKNGQKNSRIIKSLKGGNWGHAMFQLKACDYCDDIFAETADVVFGDAWLPEYTSHWEGTNVVAVRNPLIQQIIDDARTDGKISVDPLPVERAALSQAGNYRHRWDGLSLRLQDDIDAGAWHPKKRISPGSRPVSPERVKIIRLRRDLAIASHEAFSAAKKSGVLGDYFVRIKPYLREMDRHDHIGIWTKLRRMIGNTLREIGLRK